MIMNLVPKESDDPAYKVNVSISAYLDDCDLPGEPYVSRIDVRITQEWYVEAIDDGVEREVGTVEALLFHVGLAISDQKDIVEVAEELGEEVPEFCSAVMEKGTNNWRKPIEQQFGYGLFKTDLLAITEVKIKKEHRGQRLGLLAALRLMQLHGGNCGLTIIRPKNRRYWGRLGFERLGQSDFCGFPCSKPLPSLQSFIVAKSDEDVDT